MSERNGLRYGLLGLAVLILLALLLLVVRRPDAPATQAVPVDSAKIESLAEINGQAPNGRHLNIQTWQTAEGAKVLFVEARELPMLDLRLTFAAGSSQDDGVQGLAMLTNAMLNEGVPGKDVGAIAAGFESLGAEFGNGAYRDMAVASLRSLSAADKREPALQLFNQGIDRPADFSRRRPGTDQEPAAGRLRIPEAEPRQTGQPPTVRAALWRAPLRPPQ